MEDRPEEKRLFAEKRADTRDRVKIKVQYKNIQKFREDWAENISFGGMFIRSDNPLPIQTPAEITLSFPDHEKTIVLAAEVVRTVDKREAEDRGLRSGFALEFLDFIEKKHEIENLFEDLGLPGLRRVEAAIHLGPPPDETAPDEMPVPQNSPPQADPQADDSDRTEIKAILIKNMSVKDKMMLAPKADKAERAALLRDLNSSVARLIIRNPRITDEEIAQIAKNFGAPSDVLEMIAKNRKWIQNPEIRLAVVRNPRTPTPLAIAQLNYLQVKDLAVLAKSQNVRESIKSEAFKLLLKKRDKVT